MFIRLEPGKSDPINKDLVYTRTMPLMMTKTQIMWLREQLTPDQWYVYSGLLWYEQVKLELSTPTLEQIWESGFKNHMTFEEYRSIIKYLEEFYIKLPEGSIISLVAFVKEAEYACCG